MSQTHEKAPCSQQQTSGFNGFSISCSSVTMTVEHDDRRPCDDVSSIVLAGPAPSQDEAVDLLILP